MAATTPNDAAFLDYAHKTRSFLKEQPARVFGVQDLDSAIECTRNALFLCFSHLTDEKEMNDDEWAGQIMIDLDILILTTIRLLPMDKYPGSHLMTTMPQMSPGQRCVPLTDFTKKEFHVAIRLISVLEHVPDEFSNFTWSKMREEWFEDMFKKVQSSVH